jgi:6-pyruvoyltetrahydropterin/6-carboxytetrahydropterin synthase
MTIFIEDSFDSAHSLPHLPIGHKCRETHGHTYRIRIEVTGFIDHDGWVVDYAVVKAAWDAVKVEIDHKNLNAVLPIKTTCELVAEWIWRALDLPGLSTIELRETERCGVVYRGD